MLHQAETKSAPIRGPRDYKVLFSEQTLKKILKYRRKVIESPEFAGFYFRLSLTGGRPLIFNHILKNHKGGDDARLAAQRAAKNYARPFLLSLKQENIALLTVEQFIEKLLDTKIPRIFAESEVYGGDGKRDWNDDESSILGDISITMSTKVFDDGAHYDTSKRHPEPIMMDFTFVPGTLLRADALIRKQLPEITVDIAEVVVDGVVDTDKLFTLYERRLIPGWIAANAAAKLGEKIFFTVPGIGCGQFAGKYEKGLAEQFRLVLEELITQYHTQLPNVAAIYFDSWDSPITRGIKTMGGIAFIAEQGSDKGRERDRGCPELDSAVHFCEKYPELKLDPTKLRRHKLVAWDHYSYPGNEGTEGRKGTDDGVTFLASAAATNLTGFKGQYEAKRDKNYPGYELEGFKTLERAVRTGGVSADGQPAPLTFAAVDKIHVLHRGVIKQLKGNTLIKPVKVDDGVGIRLDLVHQSKRATTTAKSSHDEPSESKNIDILEQIKQKIVSHRKDQGGYELGRGLWTGKALPLNDDKKTSIQVADGAYEVYQDILDTQAKKGGLKGVGKNALLARIRTKMLGKLDVNGIGFFGLGKRSQSTVDLYKEIIELVNKDKRQKM